MSDPQVAVRFAVKDAEVVRQALQNFGKDGEAALKKFDAAAQPVPKSLMAISNVVSDVKGRATGLVGSIGLVGTALLGLGPIGLAVGAALGLVYLAYNRASEGAARLAEKSQALRSLAAVTGLTVNQAAAVSKLGVEFGVSSEQVVSFVERFTLSMDDFRKAEGPLFDAVNKIDPALARQMASTKSSAEALDLLARAYARAGEAGDKFLQARLARAAGGRGATEAAQILGTIDKGGGIQAIADANASAGKGVDEATIDRLAKLKAQIEETEKRSQRLFDSMFGERVLNLQLTSAQYWERIAEAMAKVANNGEPPRWWNLWVERTGSVNTLLTGTYDYSQDIRDKLMAEGRRRAAQQSQPGAAGADVPLPRERPEEADRRKLSAEAESNLMQRRIAILGEAATPTEQLQAKTLALAAAVEKDGTVTDAATRALDAFKRKQEETAVATRERLGLASEEEIRTVRLRALEDDRAKGFIKNAAEMALATKVATKEARDQAKAVEVKASDFPQLTKLKQDASDFRLQLDTELSGALRGVTSDILAMAKGTETAAQGFTNMATKITDAIAQAVLMKTVVGPIASSLLKFLPGAVPGTSGGADPSFGGVGSAPYAKGGVFNFGHVVPMATGGFLVDRPTIFPMARGYALTGEAGPEAVIPLRRGSGGRLGIDASGMGGGGDVHIHNYGEPIADTRVERRSNGDIHVILNESKNVMSAAIADDQMRGRGPLARLNARPPLRG